ncbi:MAG: RHS repeat-associated core domain-containing protein [Methylococcaceae bacterium]
MRVVSAVPSLLILFVTLAFLPIQATANNSSGHGRSSQAQGHSNAKHNCGWWRQCNSWFIAPQNYASGQSIQGVDPATGVLRQSKSDIVPLNSGLGLRRFYQSSAFGNSWKHQFERRLSRAQPLIYEYYEGIKSDLYRQANKACHQGWSEIRATAYNGQYSSAEAHYHQGLCTIKESGETVARLPVYRTTHHQHHHNFRTVTHPNGIVYTFVKQNQQWKALSKAPVQLKRVRNHWIFTDLDGSIEKYTNHGRLLRITNTESQTTTLKYDYYGRLKKVKDQFGNKLIFSYRHFWWGNQLKKVTSPTGTVQYSYDHWDRLSQALYQDNTTQTYHYDADACESCLTKIVNAAGEVVQQIAYDQKGRVISSEGANGSNLRNFSYGDGEVVVSDSTEAEAETHYQFNLHHGVLKIAKLTDAMGQSEVFNYDSNGYPASHTAKNGSITETEYNDRGLLEVSIENAGTEAERQTSTQWHPQYRKPTERSETTQTTAFDYDSSGRLTEQSQSPNSESTANDKNSDELEERITAFAYNELGQITETILPSGSSRQQSYDEQGNRTRSTNALGHQTQTLAFDMAGRPLKTQDSNGVITENQYDTAGRLLKTTINGLSTSYQYDSAGRQTKVTFSDGTHTENQYDSSGRLIKTINQRGEVTENTYDSQGNRIKTQRSNAQGTIIAITESSYNQLNQVIQTTDAEGNSTRFEYNASGNQTKIIDAKGNITQNQYDSQNRLTKTIDALGGETTYQYDINGNRTAVIAANGATTTFTYDNFNQLTSENSPDRGQTQYSYDISGNRIQTTDANNHTKQTQYDELNRKTQESWAGHPELTINYSYDNCENGIGKLCQVTDASGYTSYQYNSDGLVTQKQQNIQGTPLTQQFSYTNDKKLHSQTYPSGAEISYDYNQDQLVKISINQQTFIKNIQYDAAGRITGWQWADNTAYSKSYDQNGRLKSFTLGNSQRTLDYDETGNITGWTDQNSDEYKLFGYDALNRINNYNKNLAIADQNTADEILQSQSFSYDANGNRTQLVEDGTITTHYQIETGSNRLTQIDSTAREYDNNGNLINDGEHSYQYDARNRLVSIDGHHHYLYNANNQRVKKTNTETNETTLYAWTDERIFGEYDEQGSSIQETVYLDNTPIGIIKQGAYYRIHADQIDTPRAITDENNITIWRWDSKPFGESQPNEDPDGDRDTFHYNLRFPGQYYDKETQIHYNFNRYYDPTAGRYLRADSTGFTNRANIYVYAINNPLKFSDTSGRELDRDPDEDFLCLTPWCFGTWVHEQVFTPAIVRDHALYEFGYSLKAGYNSNLFNTLKPDAYDVKRRAIWELKPRTWITGSNRTKALKQVLKYTSTATSKSAENWEAGLSSKLLPLDVKVNQYRGDTFYEITFFKDPIDDRSGLVFYRFKVLN